MRLVILGSGRGSNAEAILQAQQDGRLGAARVAQIFSDRPDAGILQLGPTFGVAADFLDAAPYKTKLDGEAEQHYIAAILACRPDLLIADEPTASLDSIAQVRILDLLAREHRRAMLFVSHDPAVLYRMTDRIVVLRQGAVVEQGLEDPYARGLLAACRSMGGGE